MIGARLAFRALHVSAARRGDPHHVADPSFKEKLVPVGLGKNETVKKTMDDLTHEEHQKPTAVTVQGDESIRIGGRPETMSVQRRARIYKPARDAAQTPWQNTKIWKIELDNQERWENPNIGWASSADPLSSLGMHMKFARCEDAVRFCEKNGWEYVVAEPQERNIVPKNYGENFHWSKRTRIGCK